MKLIAFYLCLFTVIFQVIFASTFLNGDGATLSSNKTAPFKSRKSRSKAKPVVGKPVCKEELPSSRKPQNKRGKGKNVLVKENKLKLLIELLLKELVEIVIGYFIDINLHPIIVSTHNWALKDRPRIAIDSTRLYVMADADGIKGLDHSLANVKEDERRLVEFGDPQWSNYADFRSSHDGRYVSFSHSDKVLTDQGEYAKSSTKWLTQGNESEGRRIKRIPFDGEDLDSYVLSRDGQTLCINRYGGGGMNSITRVYRVREEEGKDPVAFMKFAFDGTTRAVSGNGNHVVVEGEDGFEIHDISKDASKLVCQIDVTDAIYACALNEDGSEAAFARADELRIMEVDKVNSSAMEQSAIVTVKVLESLGEIYKLMYSDEGKLHVLHLGKVSLFDPLTKELVLLDALQEEMVVDWAISPNADYIAVIQYVGIKKKNRKYMRIYLTIVKRKFNNSDWKDLFGCEVDKSKQATKP